MGLHINDEAAVRRHHIMYTLHTCRCFAIISDSCKDSFFLPLIRSELFVASQAARRDVERMFLGAVVGVVASPHVERVLRARIQLENGSELSVDPVRDSPRLRSLKHTTTTSPNAPHKFVSVLPKKLYMLNFFRTCPSRVATIATGRANNDFECRHS